MKVVARTIALFCCLLVPFFMAGCLSDKSTKTEKTNSENLIKGKIVGKSNLAKTISLVVGKGDKAKNILVKFDKNTTGMEFVKKNAAAIINWKEVDGEKVAVSVKPKLAQLPPGVKEVTTEELAKWLAGDKKVYLVDARPVGRYNQAHLPGAVSIPVPELKKHKEELLPKDKDACLVFYCGGYT